MLFFSNSRIAGEAGEDSDHRRRGRRQYYNAKTELGIYKRKQESKKKGLNQESDQENDQKKSF